jgi:hypothetical protein
MHETAACHILNLHLNGAAEKAKKNKRLCRQTAPGRIV